MNKRSKTNPCQWSRFLDFAEKNPIILTKKMEGPFGRENYNKLWTELTCSLNSMGYIVKTTEKWQKAVADWKGKVRTKAAEIKNELQKTGGGGPGKELSEIEKRLKGLMGWTSIRGDGTLELGCPSTSTISEQIPETQIEVEHDYNFQIMPPTHKNVYISAMPPLGLIGIPPKTNIDKPMEPATSRYEPNFNSTPQHSPVSTQNIPIPVEVKNSRKCKLPIQKKTFISQKRSNTVNLENMHRETLGILGEINSNLKRLGDSQEELCGIHVKILDILSQSK